MTGKRLWTPEMEAVLYELHPQHTAAEIGAALGLTAKQVHYKAHKLGLRKSLEWIAERAKAALLDPSHPAHKTKFRTGHTTWNKGMKGLCLGGTETRFKPGQRSGKAAKLWKPVGESRVSPDGYQERKISDTGVTRRDYVPIHHLVWRMHGGQVPKGHALVFRDRDKGNLDINNLELITRGELMARNTVHNLPKPIAAAIQLRGALVRKINAREGKRP